jgi:hypothetical protein
MVAVVACGGPGGTANASPSAASPRPQQQSITKIEMARSLTKEGAAESAVTTFDSATDQKLIAVLTLANLAAGTKISYTRYIDNKYVNSKTAVLKKRSRYVHFTFKPKGGATLTPGNYRMKFYVNEKAAGEISYSVK